MSVICPTILASDATEYEEQISTIKSFASRIQIDLMDGEFTQRRSINPAQVWWPQGIEVDIHLMFKRPVEHLETMVSLAPSMVILHAEADGDVASLMKHFQSLGIKAGVALLQETQPGDVADLIHLADHILLFSGKLGEFGGSADLSILDKVGLVQTINHGVEIGWDGGADSNNVSLLSAGGIDVINVGSAIQRSKEPAVVYDKLEALAQAA